MIVKSLRSSWAKGKIFSMATTWNYIGAYYSEKPYRFFRSSHEDGASDIGWRSSQAYWFRIY